jgi:hypothetical protein
MQRAKPARLAETPGGEAIEDTLLLKAIEKVVEIDCEIRWQEIADRLAGAGAAEEEAASSDDEDCGPAAGSAGGEKGDGAEHSSKRGGRAGAEGREGLLSAMARADALAAADEDEGVGDEVFGMDEGVQRLHLDDDVTPMAAKAAPADLQLGVPLSAPRPACCCCVTVAVDIELGCRCRELAPRSVR